MSLFLPSADAATRLAQVQTRIAAAAHSAQRNPNEIKLLAVSKKQPSSAIAALFALGQTAFGENYLQESLDKQRELAHLPLEWHFIGPIQSNKTRDLAAHFHWVHSVDRFKIAQRLSEQRSDDLPPLNICLQINVSSETTKSGIDFAELPELAAAVSALPRLRLRGLMAIPAPSEDFEAQRQPHAALRRALIALQNNGLPLDTLSMGMSDDLDAAILEGATWVRVGTALFGPRPPA